jgi:hypothetical protein
VGGGMFAEKHKCGRKGGSSILSYEN